MMIVKLFRLGRRQLHTIISRETIKPSSPTPSDHRYNLSLLDRLDSPSYVPLILLYPSNGNCSLTSHDKVRVLKQSLSQSLTQYYPFAGRLLTPTAPFIDCNDEGVEFVEAEIDCRLDTFSHHEPQDHLFVDGMVWYRFPSSKNILCVQLNHFSCGGIGLAISMLHFIGDACTLGSFVRYWASVACYGSTDCKEVLPLNPRIIHFPHTKSIDQIEAPSINEGYLTRNFVFPNSHLSDLKNKVIAGGSIKNPTRVEVLTSLLYKTMVKADIIRYGFFEPSYLIMLMDTRKNFVPKLPQTTIGNFYTYMLLMTKHTNETSLDVLIADIKKEKARVFEQVQSVEQAVENNKSLTAKLGNGDHVLVANRSLMCSSACGFPFNKVDFGWGKPTIATLSVASAGNNGIVLMDTPHDDGIEALVVLEKELMEIFENDREMLSFCENNHI